MLYPGSHVPVIPGFGINQPHYASDASQSCAATRVITQGTNLIFISSSVAGAFIGAAFALKFRPKSKSELIVELSDKIESLEQTLNERHIQSELDNA